MFSFKQNKTLYATITCSISKRSMQSDDPFGKCFQYICTRTCGYEKIPI